MDPRGPAVAVCMVPGRLYMDSTNERRECTRQSLEVIGLSTLSTLTVLDQALHNARGEGARLTTESVRGWLLTSGGNSRPRSASQPARSGQNIEQDASPLVCSYRCDGSRSVVTLRMKPAS